MRVGGKTIAELVQDEHGAKRCGSSTRCELSPEENGDRGKDSRRGPAAAEVPERCRAALSDARSALVHLVRRRSAADSARNLPGFATGGRMLRAGRAFDRPARRDTAVWSESWKNCAISGNTIVVVEHDPDVMRVGGPHHRSGPRRGRARRPRICSPARIAALLSDGAHVADLKLSEGRADSRHVASGAASRIRSAY